MYQNVCKNSIFDSSRVYLHVCVCVRTCVMYIYVRDNLVLSSPVSLGVSSGIAGRKNTRLEEGSCFTLSRAVENAVPGRYHGRAACWTSPGCSVGLAGAASIEYNF